MNRSIAQICFRWVRAARSPRLPVLTAITLAAAVSAHAELIPAARLTTWTPGVAVGVPGGIPTNRTHLLNVTQAPYNADNTGAKDASDAIQAAINAAQPGDVVYLPAGTYLCVKNLSTGYRSGITLRGAGESTVIKNTAGGSAFLYIGGGSDYNWSWPTSGNTITAGLGKGSTQITLADTSVFNVGQLVRIGRANDTALPVVSVNGYDLASNQPMQRQITRITAKSGNTLTIFPGLYGDYSTTKAVVHVAQFQANSVGVEDLLIDSSGSTSVFTICFDQCYGSWAKNVRIRYSGNYHIFLTDSLNCEVRHCYLDELNHAGSNGAGLLVNTVSGSLFEDNIIYRSYPHIEVNHGSSGNVFAYNFCEDSGYGVSIDANHGPHNAFNLYEGNIAPNLQSDGYFGGASQDTLFRNFFHGIINGQPGWCVSLNRFTRQYSMVGNIIGRSGYNWTGNGMGIGNPNMGNSSYTGTAQPSAGTWWKDWPNATGPSGYQELDLDVAATLVRKANYYAYTSNIPTTESLGGDTMPNSLYQSAKPAWFGTLAWPAIDPSKPSPANDVIPAGYRYVHGTDPDGVPTTSNVPATSGGSSSGSSTTTTSSTATATQKPINVRVSHQ